MKPLTLALSLTFLSACGSVLGGKTDDTAGDIVGPGACYLDTESDDSALCYTFSGIGWSAGTAKDFCETKSTAGVNIEWRENRNCPGGEDGLCEVTAIPAFGFEMYVYGEGAETGEQLCNIAGGEWTD
jgi:hypothetical protein